MGLGVLIDSTYTCMYLGVEQNRLVTATAPPAAASPRSRPYRKQIKKNGRKNTGSMRGNGAPRGSLPEEQARRLALFSGPFERLVALIRGRVRYADDYDTWHRDERADFKRARYTIGELLCLCLLVHCLKGSSFCDNGIRHISQLTLHGYSVPGVDMRGCRLPAARLAALHRLVPTVRPLSVPCLQAPLPTPCPSCCHPLGGFV